MDQGGLIRYVELEWRLSNRDLGYFLVESIAIEFCNFELLDWPKYPDPDSPLFICVEEGEYLGQFQIVSLRHSPSSYYFLSPGIQRMFHFGFDLLFSA